VPYITLSVLATCETLWSEQCDVSFFVHDSLWKSSRTILSFHYLSQVLIRCARAYPISLLPRLKTEENLKQILTTLVGAYLVYSSLWLEAEALCMLKQIVTMLVDYELVS